MSKLTSKEKPVADRAQRLLEILDLEQVEQNLYLGQNESRTGARHGRRLFGGQVLAQATMAASRTVSGLSVHSLHAYFLKGGRSALPVLYEVERIRDGKSFTTRRVVAVQGGDAIFNMDISFQVDEPGFEHAHPMPNVPPPDELEDDVAVAESLSEVDQRMSPMVKLHRPFEMRSVFRLGSDAWVDDRFWNPVWIRFREPVDPADKVLARCLLAYASDMGLVSTASLPHQSEISRAHLQMASLDHALWIHREVPIDQWMLFHKRTASAHASRGMVHADFFSSEGELVASVTQEGLLRPPRDATS
jgi:acyl-CoA thioesterase-2